MTAGLHCSGKNSVSLIFGYYILTKRFGGISVLSLKQDQAKFTYCQRYLIYVKAKHLNETFLFRHDSIPVSITFVKLFTLHSL